MISLSAIDQERFGVVTARDGEVTASGVAAALAFCRARGVKLLIARCRTDDPAAAQSLEEAGGRLMDTLIYYRRALAAEASPEAPAALRLREASPEDAEGVRRLASEAFRGYAGHYHADPRLDRRKCDEAYESWAYRSCLPGGTGAVLLAEDPGLAGFLSLRMNRPDEGEGVLFAVAPRARRTGTSRALMAAGMRWCRTRGARSMVISTQITNLASQKTWVRLGFEPAWSSYTFHLWFDA